MQQAAKTHLPDFLGLDHSYQDHRGYFLKVKKKKALTQLWSCNFLWESARRFLSHTQAENHTFKPHIRARHNKAMHSSFSEGANLIAFMNHSFL